MLIPGNETMQLEYSQNLYSLKKAIAGSSFSLSRHWFPVVLNWM